MLSLILAVVMLCSVFAAATSAFAANSGPYSYELINDGKEVKITAYNENKAILSIPSRIAGKPVTVIGSYAFSRIGRLQNVYLPLTVKTIEDHAFYESDRITFITIPSNVRVMRKARVGFYPERHAVHRQLRVQRLWPFGEH